MNAEMWNNKSDIGIWDLRYLIWNLKYGIWKLKSEIRNMKHEIQQKPAG